MQDELEKKSSRTAVVVAAKTQPVAAPSDPKILYGPDYYRHACGPIPYERSEHWLAFFGTIAEQIIRSLKPISVFDAGCAMGFLVEALWDRGVEARGIDISPYAISRVRPDMQPYCAVRSLTEAIEGHYDLVTCIEVLEHMPACEVVVAVQNICRAAGAVLFSSTPSDFDEPTHINVQPPIYWLNLFARFGFQPDLRFDCGFLTPHAMLLRRSDRALPEDALKLFADNLRKNAVLVEQALRIRALEHETQALRQAGEEELRARLSRVEAEREAFLGQVRELGEKCAALEAQDAATLAGLRDLRSAKERTESRIGDLDTYLEQVARKTESIFRSRIWRTLCAMGAVVMKAEGVLRKIWDGFRQRPAETPRSSFLLVCDEPAADGQLRAGRIRVAGWAVSDAGIDRVEVAVGGGALQQARFGLVRADVGRDLPDLPDSTRSGFLLDFDSTALPSDTHLLTIRAWNRRGEARSLSRPIVIDHVNAGKEGYERWMHEFEQRDEELIRMKLKALAQPPRISIVVPVFRTQIRYLKRAIESVLAQSYPHWELCLADDASASPELTALLQHYSQRDARIRAAFRERRGGISAASNTALELATGDWVGLLDHDDELAPDALYYVAEAIADRPDLNVIYSDEDKINETGRRYDPFFKPDWSPDLLLSENYICHFLVFRRSLLDVIGAFRGEFDGSQDYDLILRLAEATTGIHHIPRVLYHWRAIASSTALAADRKQYALEAAGRALAVHLRRTGARATVEPGRYPGRWRVRYPIPGRTRVSIIIPSGGKRQALEMNLESLFAKTTYPDYEVVVADNSRGREIQGCIKDWRNRVPNIRYLDQRDQPFNYSAINNAAARQCESPLLLFLNDDTSVIEPGWLTAMVELAVRPEVGVVGAKLLYPAGNIQHAGVVMGIFENCGHAFKGLARDRQHYFDLPDVIRNVSAVTGACLLTREEVFWKVGGFDQDKLAVAFNDVDLCLKIGRAGHRVLYTPHAVLTHHEAFSKTKDDLMPHPREVAEMKARWADIIAADPFYSPNLSRTMEDYSYRRKAAAGRTAIGS